jgi:uncharacterized protein YdeI (BOF family)
MTLTKKILLLAVLCAVMWSVSRLPRRAIEAPDALETLMKTTGSVIVEGEIQYYAALEDRFLTMDELEEVLLQVADLMGLNGGTVQRSEGDTYRVLDVTGNITLGPEIHIVVQSNPGDAAAAFPPQTYLLVVCRDASVETIKTVAQRLEAVLEPAMPGGQLSFYLSGEIPGKRTVEEMSQMAAAALSAVRGNIIDGIEEDGLVSLTAYTPLLDHYLYVDGDRFNLNLAIRYDSERDMTVCWAGYPVIHDSY